jgi:hypothetical protein
VTDLVMVVPSRGRPDAARELVAAFAGTVRGRTLLMFALDADDPALPEYRRYLSPWVAPNPEGTMVACLNRAVRDVLAHPPFAVGFMGDDHRPRTPGWDVAYVDALRRLGTGIVYGDDLLQGDRLPTQVAMTADIVETLGWMAPPTLQHLYVDNFWRDLGVHAGCLRYLPEVVVEHLHPVAGKAESDEGYERVNAPAVYNADAAAYREFGTSGAFRAAVAAVRGLQPADPGRERAVSMARASFAAEAAYITGGRTVLDLAAQPTDLPYLLGYALQVRSAAVPEPADIVVATEMDTVPSGARAVVTVGMDPALMIGYRLTRTRTIGGYPVALGVAL